LVTVKGGWQPLLDEHGKIPLVVNKEKQIPFDASEAGPGELTADVHGPSYKVPVAVDSRLGGKHTLFEFVNSNEDMQAFSLLYLTRNKTFYIVTFFFWCKYQGMFST
jgi:hypothetical protein